MTRGATAFDMRVLPARVLRVRRRRLRPWLQRTTRARARHADRGAGHDRAAATSTPRASTGSTQTSGRSSRSATACAPIRRRTHCSRSRTVRSCRWSLARWSAFWPTGAQDGEQALSIETGEALLIAGATDLRLHTQVGMAVLAERQSRALEPAAAKSSAIASRSAACASRTRAAASVALHAGEDIRVGIGMAVLKRAAAAAAAKPAEPERSRGKPPPSRRCKPASRVAACARARAAVTLGRARAGTSTRWLAGTALRLPAGTSVHLARGEDRADLRGAGEFVIGSGCGVDRDALGRRTRCGLRTRHRGRSCRAGLIIARAGDGGSEADVRIGEGSGVLTVQRGHVTLNGTDGSRELAAGDERRFALIAAAEDRRRGRARPRLRKPGRARG